ncbi:MAG: thermonuclease family protein [Alphaproteobacteria bacterium]
MELSVKKLSVIFSIAAALGGVVGGTAVYELTSPTPITQTQRKDTGATRVRVANDTGPAVEAEVLKADGNDITVRAHTWVGQFTIASINPKSAAAKTSHYAADITDAAGNLVTGVQRGQVVYLHGLEETTGAGFAITTDIPNMRPRSDVVAGPVRAHVVKVVDGDTFQVIAEIWKGTFVLTDLRVNGIDTPEKKGRAKCAHEAQLAEQASAATKALIDGKDVLLYNVQYEKYGGRVLGDAKTLDGTSVADNLVGKKLAKPYDGGTKTSWCK